MNIRPRSSLSRLRVVVSATAFSSIAVLGMALNAQAANFTLDFEQDAIGNSLTAGDGTVIDTEWSDWGINLSARKRTNVRKNQYVDGTLLLFNSNCGSEFGVACTGGDSDLATGTQFGTADASGSGLGNVLIVQEDSDFFDPDDNQRGANILFDFDAPVTFESISLLDIDDNGEGIQFVAYYDTDYSTFDTINVDDALDALFQGSDSIATQLSNRRNDNSLFSFNLQLANVTRFEVRYPGSGAIASLSWAQDETDSAAVPEPASILGVVVLGLLGVSVSRRKQ